MFFLIVYLLELVPGITSCLIRLKFMTRSFCLVGPAVPRYTFKSTVFTMHILSAANMRGSLAIRSCSVKDLLRPALAIYYEVIVI